MTKEPLFVLSSLDHLKHQEPETEEELVTIYLTSAIQTGLQRYLNQEIVISGSIEYEHDLLAAFLPHKENTIYYVLPAEAALQDRLNIALGQQGRASLFSFLIPIIHLTLFLKLWHPS